MRRRYPQQITLLAAMLLGLFLLAEGQPAAQLIRQERTPAAERLFDADGNKIVDNLDDLLADAPPDRPFRVVLVLRRSLAVALPALAASVGPFPVHHRYPSINGLAATLSAAQIEAAAGLADVVRIDHDDAVLPTIDTATHWFGVRRIRLDFPDVTGKLTPGAYNQDDIVVAVLDTGIDPNHQDFAGKIIGWHDTVTASGTPTDEGNECAFHGSHVASIAAGTGAASGGTFEGVAPGAALVGVKVLTVRTAPGLGKTCTGSRAELNAGLQWVIDNRTALGIEVANMSLSIPGCSDGQSSTERLVNEMVADGIVVAVSAGNGGPETCTIGDPSAAKEVITVAAMADLEAGPGTASLPGEGFAQAYFSSRGPTFDGRVKPDVSAPGVRITAVRGGTTNQYQVFSGTSQASPFVAGVAALLRHVGLAAPSGTCSLVGGQQVCTINDPVKDTILATADPWGGPPPNIDYGAGRLDAYSALLDALSETGNNVRVPDHLFFSGSLTGTGDADDHFFDVVTTFYPIAVAMIQDDDPVCSSPFVCAPDFDIRLFDPDGNEIASAETLRRQETIGVQPSQTGTYRLEVLSFNGSGGYGVDVSAGTTPIPPPEVLLTTDGSLAFGTLELSATADSSGDVQTVRVDLGPADIDLRTSLFSDDTAHTWSLGSANGADQVVWEFSTDGTNWTPFTVADDLFPVDQGLRDGEEVTLFLRLTMPTDTNSIKEHSATVTIVATSPD